MALFYCQISVVLNEKNTPNLRNQSSSLGPILGPKYGPLRGVLDQ